MKKIKLFKTFIFAVIIMALSFNNSVYSDDLPKTLINYKPFHDSIYSQKIASEGYTSEEIESIESFLNKAISDSDFSMAVFLENMDSILDEDKFKSGVERFWEFMKDSEYDSENITRIYATPEFFNIAINDLVGSDYEKYGYLSCKDKRQDFLDTGELFEYYGNVIVNFKKENLINRTTMTIGDSLNKRHKFGIRSVTPTLVNDPKLVCIPGYFKSYAELLLNSIKTGELLAQRPNLITQIINKDTGFAYFEYFELQFHGDLSFSKDVESVDMIRTYIEDESEREEQYALQQRIATRIKDLGITCNIIDCTDINSQAEGAIDDYPTPEFAQTVQTEDGKVMIKSSEGIFKAGSQLYATFLDPKTQKYYNTFDNLDTEFKNIAQRLKIYDVFVLDPYGEKITKFDDYVTLYIQIPDNYDETDLEAIHITDQKDQEFDEWIETLEGKKFLAFKTNHFSPYAILDKDVSSSNFLIYIFIAICIATLIVTLFFFCRKRNKTIKI